MIPSVAIGLISLAGFIILIFCGIPVSVCMMICGVGGCMFLLTVPSSAINFLSDSFVYTFTGYTTSVIPMFMLMGEIASASGIGTNLFKSTQIIAGRINGSLASAVQVACAVFGAICGSGGATASLMSRVAYPEMKRYGYSDELAVGCIASGASLATLIPPSLTLIAFGIAAEESIGKLFMGGVFTGLVLMVLFIIVIQIWCIVKPDAAPKAEATSMNAKLKAVREGSFIEIILVFGLSMGGMFAGWFTPTEAGAVGVFGMLIVSLLTRRLTFKLLFKAVENTLVMSGMIYCLLAGAGVLGKLFTLSRIPILLGDFVMGLEIPTALIIFVITLIYLILGCFIDVLPLVLLTTPIFLPVVQALGYSAVWFGCYVVVVGGLGAITPPVGMSCYVVAGTCEPKVPLQRVFKGSVPFIFAFLGMTFIMSFFPDIATWLPNVVFG